ncbi:PREDICTED: chymotrypsin BI-like [Ceratosolen solmsi marchali]|uniref:Chymotrypsin BI-like n=1 Tax=Ceratosolen solmsi marchali TaxID=326594 RepID=A0AAJ6YCN0_9HYME|nr:PREDICTED: chymotrypsin BI-like [Ceratosolen solmsi marchali]
MRLTICFLFIQNIFYNKAMVGENVRRAVDQEFPYIVSIKVINNLNREPESDHGCAGIILSPKDILTVAHCLDGVLMIKIEVIVGSVDIRQGTKYQPNEFITYNSWAKNNNKALIQTDNDIAVLKCKLSGF